MSSEASRQHYARLTSEQGAALRSFFNEALADHDRLPGRRALKAKAEALAEAMPALDADKLMEQFVAYANAAQRREGHAGHRFRLKGEVDQLTSELVKRMEDDDRLVAAPERVDTGALAQGVIDSQDPQGARKSQAGFVDQAMEGGR